MSDKKLKRVMGNYEWLGGVCAGIAYRLEIPTWVVRAFWTLIILIYGVGVIPYILLWVFMPIHDEVPKDYERICE